MDQPTNSAGGTPPPLPPLNHDGKDTSGPGETKPVPMPVPGTLNTEAPALPPAAPSSVPPTPPPAPVSPPAPPIPAAPAPAAPVAPPPATPPAPMTPPAAAPEMNKPTPPPVSAPPAAPAVGPVPLIVPGKEELTPPPADGAKAVPVTVGTMTPPPLTDPAIAAESAAKLTPPPSEAPKMPEGPAPLTPESAKGLDLPAVAPTDNLTTDTPAEGTSPKKGGIKTAIILILSILAFLVGGTLVMSALCVGPNIGGLAERFGCQANPGSDATLPAGTTSNSVPLTTSTASPSATTTVSPTPTL